MQSLRDKLLEAGLVTREQVDRSKAAGNKRGPGGGARGGAKAAPEVPRSPPRSKEQRLKERPVRVLDLSDPARLGVLQAIEAHRLREDTLGDEPFCFTLRDGRIRKLFVSPATVARLEAGALAIVENGADDHHLLVHAAAVEPIRAIDPEAVRFHNGS
jgi:uncharacterized protein YaiL (DUF2058 family)